MNADDFRRIALALPDTEEGRHGALPTFLVRNKRFATLGWPDAASATVGLFPDEREVFMTALPHAVQPAAGAWGARGHTVLRLAALDEPTLTSVLAAAWRRSGGRRG